MWPAQRGLGRSLWLQAAQEKDAKKRWRCASRRSRTIASHSDDRNVETGKLRADESRTTFLASIKDVFDEAASAYAALALLTNPSAGAPLSGKSLEYAGGRSESTNSRARVRCWTC